MKLITSSFPPEQHLAYFKQERIILGNRIYKMPRNRGIYCSTLLPAKETVDSTRCPASVSHL